MVRDGSGGEQEATRAAKERTERYGVKNADIPEMDKVRESGRNTGKAFPQKEPLPVGSGGMKFPTEGAGAEYDASCRQNRRRGK